MKPCLGLRRLKRIGNSRPRDDVLVLPIPCGVRSSHSCTVTPNNPGKAGPEPCVSVLISRCMCTGYRLNFAYPGFLLKSGGRLKVVVNGEGGSGVPLSMPAGRWAVITAVRDTTVFN